MPFATSLPPENTDPWYTPLVNAWTALTNFVNGLETAIAGKANTADLGSAASQPTSAFATAAQGTKADTAVQPATLTAALAGKADSSEIIVLGVLDDGEVPPAPGVYLRRPAP